MALTNFPNGVSSFGVPQMAAGFGTPSQPNGNVWWVLSGASGSGTSPEDAFGTIQGAVDRAISGDTIMVFGGDGYDETVTVTTDYLSIIGAQIAGYARPDLAPDAGSALLVQAQGFYTRHMRFASADSDTVVWNGNGGQAVDCVFDGDSGQASTETNLRLVENVDDSHTASENQFVNCLFRGSNGSGVTFQHGLAVYGGDTTSDNQFIACTFVDNAVSDLISKVNTNGGGAGIYKKLVVTGCQFETVGAAYKYINFSAGAAGDLTANSCLISGNWFADEALTGGAGNQIDLAGQAKAMFVGNFDAAGIVNGAAFN